ncbi:DUF2938 family protein [Ornithinimicrobium cryptoxanthini]|uniref:DUF2938 family protein n=1 Tax=Ornithinimicrobium cryptoxanthini TaxID=2934161 RepID=UPI00351BF04F
MTSWVAHYATGITFALVLLGVTGIGWAHLPTLWPALLVGWVAIVALWFVLQPGMGLRIAAWRTAHPDPQGSGIWRPTRHTASVCMARPP